MKTLSLDDLVCVETKQRLNFLEPGQVAQLNESLLAGNVRDASGFRVFDEMEQGLVREDGKLVYPVRMNIPIMLLSDALPMAGFEPVTSVRQKNHPKSLEEFDFWVGRWRDLGTKFHDPERTHSFYENHFNIPEDYVAGKRVMDIGPGARGSLTWAKSAKVRVGLDPLSRAFFQLGCSRHDMDYIAADAEEMPFADAFFDVVSSINSLDHVDVLEPVVSEIMRVLKPGGKFLLYTDIHSKPTVCEPIAMKWTISEMFTDFQVDWEKHFEYPGNQQVPFNHDDPTDRMGGLFAVYTKRH